MSKCTVTDLGGVEYVLGVDVGGFITPDLGGKVPLDVVQNIFDTMPDYKFRKDDIMLCTYQKTGTNWLYEILSMINNRSAERVKTNKLSSMMEVTPGPTLDALPSPRVLNCHFPFRYLPKDLSGTKPKTVLCVRNPKDTAVSYFNHTKGLKQYQYDGKFANWLPLYLDGKLEYGKYTEYLKEWEKAINDGVDIQLHIVYYEDLKVNGAKELDRLLKFLEMDLEDKLKSDILDACHFDKMAENKTPKEMADQFLKSGFNFFRKGQIGDWKNWFTVADNEMFDHIWKAEMKESKLFNFVYTDPRVKV